MCFNLFDVINRQRLKKAQASNLVPRAILRKFAFASKKLFRFPLIAKRCAGDEVVKLVEIFSVARINQKHVVLRNNLYCACSEILSYSRTFFSRLIGINLHLNNHVLLTPVSFIKFLLCLLIFVVILDMIY